MDRELTKHRKIAPRGYTALGINRNSYEVYRGECWFSVNFVFVLSMFAYFIVSHYGTNDTSFDHTDLVRRLEGTSLRVDMLVF